MRYQLPKQRVRLVGRAIQFALETAARGAPVDAVYPSPKGTAWDLIVYEIGPVFRLVELVELHGGRVPRNERSAVAGLHAAVHAAIVGGMRWTRDDARAIYAAFGIEVGQYRFRFDEEDYRLAVEAENTSAQASILTVLRRAEWAGSRTGPIALGRPLWVEDCWWHVTSITDEKIGLCQYESGFVREGKPTKKLTFDRTKFTAFVANARESA
jgi:hypothetical protein